MRRAWAIAFVVTWFVVTIVLNSSGFSDHASARWATLAAVIVAVVVWYLVRTFGPGRAPRREE
jgi:hypothetical protein